MRTTEEIYGDKKVLEKNLKSIHNLMDLNQEEYEKAILKIVKKDLDLAKEKLQKVYDGIANVSTFTGKLRITFLKTENRPARLHQIKTIIEHELKSPGMFNVKGSNKNTYGEFKTVNLTLTKSYLKKIYNIK